MVVRLLWRKEKTVFLSEAAPEKGGGREGRAVVVGSPKWEKKVRTLSSKFGGSTALRCPSQDL